MMTFIWIYFGIGIAIYAISKIGLAIMDEKVFEVDTFEDFLVELVGGILLIIAWPYQVFIALKEIRDFNEEKPVMKVHFGTNENEEEKP